MCEWGNEILMTVTVPAHLSSTGNDKQKQVGIDACIAPIVQALIDAGIPTASSCCGHGKEPGCILLCDGRKLIIR